MEMPERIRRIFVARLPLRAAEQTSILLRLRQKKTALAAAFCAALLACGTALAQAHGSRQEPAPRMQSPAPAWGHGGNHGYGNSNGRYGSPNAAGPRSHGEHLPQWYRRHQNLSPQQQERALRTQPGFNRLPPWKQQRLFERLRQLNAMPPLQRERTLQRMEALERLSPEQRRQVRATVQQIFQMPMERRRRIRDAFESLSQSPPPQRQALLNSPEFKRRFTPHELQMLTILMTVEPYTPATPYGPGAYGGPPR